jgi:hypothetical protein
MQLVDGIAIDYAGLPESHRQAVMLYIEHGCDPGYGLTLILCNDLRAVVCVDDRTAQALPQIYRWLVNHAPSRCWWAIAKVDAWARERRSEQPK